MKAARKKPVHFPAVPKTCEAETVMCSGELMAEYGVNESEKKGETFALCGVCAVLIRKGGSKLKQV